MVDQSAFVNVSIFDKYYLESLFGGVEFPDGTFAIDYIDDLIEHQKLFMETVSEIRSHNMFTFPVLTYSLLKRDDITEKEAQEMLKTRNWNIFKDKEFARWCSDHNTTWNDSNFFMNDNVGVLSNCPMSADTPILWADGSDMFTVTPVGELYEDITKFKRTIKVRSNGKLVTAKINKFGEKVEYKIVLENGLELKTTAVHLNKVYGKDYVETWQLTTDDMLPIDKEVYLTHTTYRLDGKKYLFDLENDIIWVKIKEIIKGDFGDTAYCLEVLEDVEPVFTLANGIVTHNCRLLSDTSKLDGFINSIGGTALSIGSVKVNTINLMRIAYEAMKGTEIHMAENVYLNILRDRTTLCCQALDVIRHIIGRNIEKGLLPNYCDGGIEMSKQYCTVGILGLYEVIEAFGYTTKDQFGNVYYTEEGIEFASKIFACINEVKDNFTDEYSFNVESVPAERAAVILCQKDNLLYEKKDKFIYSNQWIPLSEKCTIQEKLKLSSILDVKCSGGSIAHINLEQNFPNTDVAWDMLNMIALSGVIYFAFNTRINECKNHHGFVGTDVCPECGEGVMDTYQRIVGFLEPVRSYSADRKREFNTRQWYAYADMKGEL